MLFHSYTVGIASLWLLGHKIANRRRFTTFLLALAIMTIAGLIGIISYGMTDFSSEGLAILMSLGVLAFTMLFGFVLAGRLCRNRYSNLRFMLWLALWCEVVCLASMLVFYSIMLAIYRPSISLYSLYAILFQILLVSPIFGLCAYLVVLPYMILAFRSSFFLQRFYDCFHLPAIATLRTDVSGIETAQQNDISETGGS